MTSRADIDQILDRAYAARKKHDVQGVFECFTSDGQFRQGGQDEARVDAVVSRAGLQGLFDAMELVESHEYRRVIEAPLAVVHWRGKFHARNTGETRETEVLDLVEVRDGKIASLTTFFDTALLQAMLTPK
jgi:ketosteroid isomerase-like protein